MLMRGDPPVDVSAHLGDATVTLWVLLAAVLVLIVVRFDLWRKLWLGTTDPRPVALFRILLGGVALWSLLDLLPYATLLFSDEGLFPPHVARMRFVRDLDYHWHPEHGFEHWYDSYKVLAGRASLLHLHSPPLLTYSIFAATIVATLLMIVGLWTRISTLVCWFGVHTLFLYAPLWHAGGDTVLRIFLLLGVCSRWGEAYSIDRLRRVRRALRDPKSSGFPGLRAIPGWPVHMMLIQLTVIYATTGWVKTGVAWREGTALYYATSLAHFYRFPEQVTLVSYLQGLYILPVMTWIVHLWEAWFVLALVGVMLRAYERERMGGMWLAPPRWRQLVGYTLTLVILWACSYLAGLSVMYYFPERLPTMSAEQAGTLIQGLVFTLPIAAALGYRYLRRFAWVRHIVCNILLGRRLWLGLGVAFHLGIEVLINVGLFVQVMLAPYVVWLRPDELRAGFAYLVSRPLRPGEGPRPQRTGGWVVLRPYDRLRYRNLPAVTVLHLADGQSLRNVAHLRCWDVAECVDYEVDEQAGTGLTVRDGDRIYNNASAALVLCQVFPLWMWLMWLAKVPGLRGVAETVAARVCRPVTHQANATNR